ncbi:antA/AntB antirepressor family protein [Pseudomonas citronellolis]|uniref:antA/AntB antirepressor family protein n=1 Tax=Pseudomonas citronellolis TaxID=53408 RepID=UPI002D767587|nr:antA/AntB antirepressor family protein [Pseudomonas citronellolis]WRT82719.1 antA/AntB antirepressor family protein [Pseudomonas citronellolis]
MNATAIPVENNVQAATESLIPVFTGALGDDLAQLVDARSLHRFLGVDARFNDWVTRRIAEYDFQDGEDFYSFLSKSSGGRPSREYHITLDMAKELSMVERNEKGRQARRYFIECERRLHELAPADLRTIAGKTIGTDGFHMLGALIKGKVSSLPVPIQRRATAKIWSQTHAAFGVRTAADIPAEQLDAARAFIAAYALPGEWMPKELWMQKEERESPCHLLPPAQAKEILDRLTRLGQLFHPFSNQFGDVIGIGRALRGLHPRIGVHEPGYRQVIPRIG